MSPIAQRRPAGVGADAEVEADRGQVPRHEGDAEAIKSGALDPTEFGLRAAQRIGDRLLAQARHDARLPDLLTEPDEVPLRPPPPDEVPPPVPANRSEAPSRPGSRCIRADTDRLRACSATVG